MKKFTILALFSIIAAITFAQETPVQWQVEQTRDTDGSYVLDITAEISHNWYMYGMNMDEGGPLPLYLSFDNSKNLTTSCIFKEVSKAKTMYDDVFEMDVMSYTDKVHIRCVFVPKTDVKSLDLIIDGQACNKKDGSCIQVYESIPINF